MRHDFISLIAFRTLHYPLTTMRSVSVPHSTTDSTAVRFPGKTEPSLCQKSPKLGGNVRQFPRAAGLNRQCPKTVECTRRSYGDVLSDSRRHVCSWERGFCGQSGDGHHRGWARKGRGSGTTLWSRHRQCGWANESLQTLQQTRFIVWEKVCSEDEIIDIIKPVIGLWMWLDRLQYKDGIIISLYPYGVMVWMYLYKWL